VLLAKAPYVRLFEGELPRRLPLTSKDLPALSDTLQQLVKQFFLHGYSISTILRRACRSSIERSSLSFLAKIKSIRILSNSGCPK
jgi:hypothetical protein